MAHKLVCVSTLHIEKPLKTAKLDFKEQQDFNTHNHSHDEISTALPGTHHYPPEDQPWILLGPFLSIIAASQGYDKDEVHRISLPRPIVTQLYGISRSASILGSVSESDKEDLDAFFPHFTTRGLEIESLVNEKSFSYAWMRARSKTHWKALARLKASRTYGQDNQRACEA